MFGKPSNYHSGGPYTQPAGNATTPYGGVGFGLGQGAGGMSPVYDSLAGGGARGMTAGSFGSGMGGGFAGGGLMNAMGPIPAMGGFGGHGAMSQGPVPGWTSDPAGATFTGGMNGFVGSQLNRRQPHIPFLRYAFWSAASAFQLRGVPQDPLTL